MGNGNRNGILATLDPYGYENRNREHPVAILLGKVGEGKWSIIAKVSETK